MKFDDYGKFAYNPAMIGRYLIILTVLLGTVLTAADSTQDSRQSRCFSYLGQDVSLEVIKMEEEAHVWLTRPSGRICLSSQIPGENLFPTEFECGGDLLISWVNYYQARSACVVWRWSRNELLLLPLPGFHFTSSPVPLCRGTDLLAVLFQGNRTDRDGLYLIRITPEPAISSLPFSLSVKRWDCRPDDSGWRIDLQTLKEEVQLSLGYDLTVAVEKRSIGSYISRERTIAVDPCREINTFLAFGDSITWGKMRMNNLVGEYHPELAYPNMLLTTLLTPYGVAYALNRGYPGDTTLNGLERIDAVLQVNRGAFFLLMLGTNDCISNQMSVDGSLENLRYIIDRALDYNFQVIVSTIPPRKDSYGDWTYVKKNIDDLNAGILDLVVEMKGEGEPVKGIDLFQAMMDTTPPDGWKRLLEDIIGNHLSPDGHILAADLFAEQLVQFPPQTPSGIIVEKNTITRKQIAWSSNCESDFRQYNIEYGFSAKNLNRKMTVTSPQCTFYTFPFLSSVYFRIQTEDKSGVKSPFTAVTAVEWE